MRYSDNEVRVLITEYMELRESLRPFVLHRKLDLQMASRRLNPTFREPVVMLYALHIPVRWVADHLGVSENTVYVRAESGLDQLVLLMNGGS